MRNGKGKFFNKKYNFTYEGDWIKGLKHGIGIIKYNSGAKYEGEFYWGKKNGKGIYYYPNGDVYIGDWKRDKKEGKGKMFWLE